MKHPGFYVVFFDFVVSQDFFYLVMIFSVMTVPSVIRCLRMLMPLRGHRLLLGWIRRLLSCYPLRVCGRRDRTPSPQKRLRAGILQLRSARARGSAMQSGAAALSALVCGRRQGRFCICGIPRQVRTVSARRGTMDIRAHRL